MFRVITENIDKPVFWLVCDNRSCGCSARADVDMSSTEANKQSQARFVATALQEGWIVGLDAQFCPFTARDMQAAWDERKQKSEQLVKPVSGFDDLRFDAARLKVLKH